MNWNDTIALRKISCTSDGLDVPQRMAVVNTISNRVIGIVSPRYKVIHNTDLLKVITPTLEDLKVDGSNPQIRTTKGGAVTFFKFLGDKVTGEIQKGDVVRFGIEFFNSYDGSMPVGFHIIAERLVCTNGLVVPKSITEIHIRHIGDVNIGTIKNRVKEYFPKTIAAINLWKKWSETRPQEYQLDSFLRKVTGERLRLDFMNRYKNLPKDKQNLWEFYNLITYHISHQIKTRKEDTKALKQFTLTERFTNKLTTVFSGKETEHETANLLS